MTDFTDSSDPFRTVPVPVPDLPSNPVFRNGSCPDHGWILNADLYHED